MTQKKILYVTPGLPIGGAEKFLILLSGALGNYTAGQVLVNLGKDSTLQPEFDKRVRMVDLPRRYKTDFGPITRLRRLIKTEKPDIIFCVNFFSYFIVRCSLILSGNKTSRVISYHSTIHLNKKEHLLHKLYTAILTKKDTIVTVSFNQAKYTAGLYGIAEQKFKTIHNGIDTRYWHPPAAGEANCELRKKHGIPADARVIIKSAAFRAEKNHLGAIKALQILHNTYQTKAYLLLIGNGYMMEPVQALVKELNMQEYVKFAGLQKDVRQFYWISDLFTLCSTNVETFSIAALEAMACGLPSVLTDIGGASEMILEGQNGYLCQPNENDIALAWNKALKQSFSRDSIHRYTNNHFSAEKMLNEYKEIFATLN
jgi:glycosyltransferase involved in cell wall biosynthesis